MAIAPIDLQAMYAQMGHLAKTVADQQNGPHLSQQLQESKFIQQNAEKAKSVKKAADDESKTMIVGKDGRRKNQDSGTSADGKNENKKSGENSEESKVAEIRESYLGTHINIST